jgi:hypothetical protein
MGSGAGGFGRATGLRRAALCIRCRRPGDDGRATGGDGQPIGGDGRSIDGAVE